MDSLPGSFRCKIFRMSHGIPNDIKMANEFAPNEFETPTPPSPFRTINTLDIPSGIQPPAARNVNPITASGILKVKPEKKKKYGNRLNYQMTQNDGESHAFAFLIFFFFFDTDQ